jgi:hypothetical protein
MRVRSFIGFSVVLALLSVAGVARARAEDQKALAKQHFGAGEAKFKAGDYRGAIGEFQAADALVPSPILSYNIALCHERLGEDEAAVVAYRAYLQRRPDAQNRAQVEERIKAAEQRIAAKNVPPPAPVPQPQPKPEPPAPKVEGPVAPPPPVEGPALPPAKTEGPAVPGSGGGGAGPVDEALVKRLPDRRPAPQNGNPSQMIGQAGTGGSAAPMAPMAGDAQPAPAAPLSDSGKKKAKPVYKEWWFWAVVGVSAIIVIDVLSSDGNSNDQPGGASSGATVFTF